ncbi:winged helix-turn-helix transcriptional regulator [Acinetobacter rathckeae]|uniref:winged helix-turn-helix transcriptional regulator n=1 Tax=Acinetobacter rathckeae TaxID=2605272 RepID=UPI0018A32AE8|nr:helix-turn-helix domain-containing protein [Acinetobacter rathckeae]MBF7688141.1 helix-turn-helix transcriptional regulator [Acinetobacter rathckeae]MBF7695347.1 helix-turn-helix transcriptional regulator [Acinetobacter rathckeae]
MSATPLKGYVLSSQCPSRQILEHLTSKWSVLILRCLSQHHVLRFSQLKHHIDGVSEKMLSQTLRMLEQDDFITRKVYAEIPPKVEYRLTELGQQAAEKIDHLVFWIEENLEDILASRQQAP